MLDERLIIDIEGNRRYQFRYSVKIEVTNLTPDRLVQLAVVGYARGVTSVKEGAFEAILPGQKATFLWTREVDSEFLFQMKEFELGYFLFDMRPMVNDNGFNVEDYYVFHEELRFFEAHGSQIIVYPEPIPPNTWGSGVVAPLRSDERVYTRLLRKRV